MANDTHKDALRKALDDLAQDIERALHGVVAGTLDVGPLIDITKTARSIAEKYAQPEQQPVAWAYWLNGADPGKHTPRLSDYEPLAYPLRKPLVYASPIETAAKEGWKLVPLVPTGEQWGGLARDIIMWHDMNEGGNKTPRALFKHLEILGHEVPQWLRDEPEMRNIDHVPSKGTRAAIIYRAMVEAAPQPPQENKG